MRFPGCKSPRKRVWGTTALLKRLHLIASRRRTSYRAYNWSLFAFAEPAMPANLSAADRWYLAIQMIGIEAAMPMPFQPVSQYCSGDAMSDAAVRARCNALAELLVSKATTLLDFSMGKSLGARVGWQAERVDQLTQQFNASEQVIAQVMPSDP